LQKLKRPDWQRLHFAARPERIERNVVAHFEAAHAGAEFDDFAGRLMADDGGHPGKGAVGAEFP